MLLNHFGLKGLAFTASISLTAIAFIPSVKAQEQPSMTQSNNCAIVVNAPNGLKVHAYPSTNSTVLGTLRNRQPVTVEANHLEGWIQVASPIQGYVFGKYLTWCRLDQQSN